MSLPIPPDARTVLPTLTLTQAARHYGVSRQAIKRWAAKVGVASRETTAEDFAEFAKLARRHYLPAELPAEKQCTACLETKPAAAFRQDRTVRGTPYLYGRCKACLSAGKTSQLPRRRPEPLPDKHSGPWERDLYMRALRAFGGRGG